MGTKTEPVIFQPGELLVQEKTASDAIYVIKSGQLQAYKMKDDVRIPLGIISSGEYVGEMAVLRESTHNNSVVALTEVEAVKLPKKIVQAELEKLSPWFLALVRGIAERLHDANELLRKNNLIDDSMQTKIKAIEEKAKKAE